MLSVRKTSVLKVADKSTVILVVLSLPHLRVSGRNFLKVNLDHRREPRELSKRANRFYLPAFLNLSSILSWML